MLFIVLNLAGVDYFKQGFSFFTFKNSTISYTRSRTHSQMHKELS